MDEDYYIRLAMLQKAIEIDDELRAIEIRAWANIMGADIQE